jgi:MFS family permease
MAIALGLLAALAKHPSRATTGIGLALFGLGFGMVGQVLIVAVQNSVDRSRLGIAMATTTFFRGLGGAIGAAVLGAIFSASAGTDTAGGTLRALSPAARTDVIHGVQTVFLVAAPIATLALLVVLLLKEVPLQGPNTHQANRPAIPNAPAQSNSNARGPALSREIDVRPRST